MPINMPQLNPQLLAGAAPQGLSQLMPSFLGGMETQRKTQQQQTTNVTNALTASRTLKQIASQALEQNNNAAWKKYVVALGPDWMGDEKKVRQARAKYLEIFSTKPPFDALAAAKVEERIPMINPALGEDALGSMTWVTPDSSEHADLSAQGFIEHDYKIPEKKEPGKVVTYIDPGVADPRASAESVREGSAEEDAKIALGWVPWTYKLPTKEEAKVEESLMMVNPNDPSADPVWVKPNSAHHAKLAQENWVTEKYKRPDETLGRIVTYVNIKASNPMDTAKNVHERSTEEAKLAAIDTDTEKWVPKSWQPETERDPPQYNARFVWDRSTGSIADSFDSRNEDKLDEWTAKMDADRLATGDQRYLIVGKPAGMSIPDAYGFETAAQRDQAKITARVMRQGAAIAREVLGNIEESRTRAGIVGWIKGAGQTFAAMVGDLSNVMSENSMRGFVVQTQRWVTNLEEEDKGFSQQDVYGWFDPKLSLSELYENSMAIRWARHQYPKGRLMKDVIEWSKKDVRITGLTSVIDVVSRYEFLRDQFEGEAEILENMSKQYAPAPEKTDPNITVIETRIYDSGGKRIDTPTGTRNTFASVILEASVSDLLLMKRVLETQEATSQVLEDLRLVETRLTQLQEGNP